MALYSPSLSYQRDSSPTLYPGEQNSYPEPHSHPGNIQTYLNQASSAGSYSDLLSGSSLPPYNCDEIPSIGGRNEMVFIPPTSDTMSLQSFDGQLNNEAGNIIGNSVTGNSKVTHRTQPSILAGKNNFQCQGLSLSLSTQIPSAVSVPSFQYQFPNLACPSFLSTHHPITGKGTISFSGNEKNQESRHSECMPSGFTGGNYNNFPTEAFWNPQCSVSPKEMHVDTYQYDPTGFTSIILNSKYLKATKQLLDEVVNVREALKQPDLNKRRSFHGIGLDVSKETDGSSNSQDMLPGLTGMSSEPSELTRNSSELSPSEQQGLQNKKIKLLSMLDEVDKRYKQYCHQMQVVVSYFEMVAGCRAAKPYTALALQTISRHFRCLRDTLCGQIQLAQRRLGEQDTSSNGQGERIPRLRYVDHQLRQNKSLQQLGVMRPAWRPQRGLPESSVSILRSWLFEHFLHPYPKESEKIMLAKQTGLTRNQVANWFINARVRLWKPMIEEMYKEELGDSDVNSKSSQENALKAQRENSTASEVKGEELQDSVTSTAVDIDADADAIYPGHVHDLKSCNIPNVEMNRLTERSLLQNGAYTNNMSDSGMMRLLGDRRPSVDDHGLILDEFMQRNQNGNSNLVTSATASYDISDLGGFVADSQVSLALGLRHHEGDVFSMSGGNEVRGNKTVFFRGI